MSRNTSLSILCIALTAALAGCASKPAAYTTAPPASSSVQTSTSAQTTAAATSVPTNSTTTALVTTTTTSLVASASTPPASTTPAPSTATSSTPTQASVTIEIGADGVFTIKTLNIAVGTIVNFDNQDCCNAHKLSSDLPFSGALEASSILSITFNRAGKYLFWIDDNQSITGTIIVS